MNTLGYLLTVLGVMTILYVFYRHSFLKKPKSNSPHKPHFTLKVEPE